MFDDHRQPVRPSASRQVRHSGPAVMEALEERLLLAVTGTAESHAMSLALPVMTWNQSGSVDGVIARGDYTSHQHSEITDEDGTHISDSLAEPWTEGTDPGWIAMAFPLAATSHNTAYIVNGGAMPTGAQSSAFIDYIVSVYQTAPLPQWFPLSTFYIPVRSQFYLKTEVAGAVGQQLGIGTADAYVEVCLSNGSGYAKEEVESGWPSDQGSSNKDKTATFSNMVAYSPSTLGSDYISIHFTAAGSAQVTTVLNPNATIETTSSANVQDISFDQAAFSAIWGDKSFTLSNYFVLQLGWDPAHPVPAGPGTFDLTGTMNPMIMPTPTSSGAYNLVQLELSNSGSGPATGFSTMQLWASLDGVLGSGGDDYKLSETRPYIYSPVGGKGYAYFSYTIPGGIPSGTYDLIAVIDSASDIPETNNGNNQVVIADRLVIQVPDLTGAGTTPLNPIILPNPTAPGGYHFVQLAVRNAGAVTASGFSTMQLWASLDGTLGSGGDDYKLSETRPYLYIPAGGTGYVFFSYTVPANIPAGTYDLIAVIDSANDVTESNEANNRVVIADRFVLQNPDLTGALTTPLNPIVMGATVKRYDFNFVELRVRNAGAVTASGFASMQLWASLDGTLGSGGGDYKLNEIRPYLYIPAGGTGYCYFSYLVPASGIPNGTYDLIAVIDSNGDVLETNEANNQVRILDRFVLANPITAAELAPSPLAQDAQRTLSTTPAAGLVSAKPEPVSVVPDAETYVVAASDVATVTDVPLYAGLRATPGDVYLASAPVSSQIKSAEHYRPARGTSFRVESEMPERFEVIVPL